MKWLTQGVLITEPVKVYFAVNLKWFCGGRARDPSVAADCGQEGRREGGWRGEEVKERNMRKRRAGEIKSDEVEIQTK